MVVGVDEQWVVDLIAVVNIAKSAQLVTKGLLYRLDWLFAFYHRQWCCHRQMFYHFKWCRGCLNALALMIVVGSVFIQQVCARIQTTLIKEGALTCVC